jgi:hypothetical protein
MVQGWCSVEELTHWAFSQSPVVMANEAHNGLARCVRTRRVGVRQPSMPATGPTPRT